MPKSCGFDLSFLIHIENFHSQISYVTTSLQNGAGIREKRSLARDTRILEESYNVLRAEAGKKGYMSRRYFEGRILDRMNEIRGCLKEAIECARPYTH